MSKVEFPDNPVGYNTWRRRVEHYMATIYGISCDDAGVDRCDLHNVHYRDHATLGGAQAFVLEWGDKYALTAINEPSLPKDLPSKPTEPGLYLKLFNGREFPDQELNDWGVDGPTLGPLNYVHTTYASEVKYEFAERADPCGFEVEGYFSVYDDTLEVDGVYYGDWSVVYYSGG